jgi:ABC-type glycerol-3-phosphate transport system permease component
MWAQGAEGVAPPELVKEFESANPGVNATDYGLLLAGSVLVITPIVTLFVSLQRFFI